jgi:hypothetical protein
MITRGEKQAFWGMMTGMAIVVLLIVGAIIALIFIAKWLI